MMKIVLVVAARPNFMKVAPIWRELAKAPDAFEPVLVHTGQNYDYELNEIFFHDLEIRKPDHFLNAAGGSAAETIGKIIIVVDIILAQVQPDALLVLGDTNSCMAVLPAKRRKVPVFQLRKLFRRYSVPLRIIRVHLAVL